MPKRIALLMQPRVESSWAVLGTTPSTFRPETAQASDSADFLSHAMHEISSKRERSASVQNERAELRKRNVDPDKHFPKGRTHEALAPRQLLLSTSLMAAISDDPL